MNEKKLKPYILTATALFFGFMLDGYITASQNPEYSKTIFTELSKSLSFTKDLNQFYLFLFILFNNFIKTFAFVILSTIFSLASVFFIILNGFIIGMVINIVGVKVGLMAIALGIIPHGIFEIPATIISTALGIWLGVRFYYKVFRKEEFKQYFYWAMKFYFQVVFPLILMAAIIESFVTPIFSK